jgi:hypothetical protein
MQIAKDTTSGIIRTRRADRTGAYLFARMAGKTDFDTSRFRLRRPDGRRRNFRKHSEASGRNSLVWAWAISVDRLAVGPFLPQSRIA